MSSANSHRPFFQHLLRLPRPLVWRILEALQNLCEDPNLLGLHEEDGEQFILVAGHAVFVDIDEDSVTAIALRKLGIN